MKKIFEILITNYKKSALIFGALSSLAFAPLFIFPIFFLSLSISLLIVDNLSTNKKACVYGYLFGFAHFVVGLYWIANALLVDFVAFGWLYPITLICIGAFFGLFIIPSFAVWHLLCKKNIWIKVVYFACIWVLLEWVRSFFLTGFPWNMLGTIFAFHEMFIQTASIWGTYGLSFIAILISGCIYAMFKHHKVAGFLVLCFIALSMSIFGFWRVYAYDNLDSDIKIRLVQPSIPQSMKWKKSELENNFLEYVNLSKAKESEKIDFVIWGETALPFDIEYNYKYKELIKDAVPDNGYLITGVVRIEPSYDKYKPYNSMYVINNNADVVNFYDKNHLVPFGEYIPFRKYLPQWVRPITNTITDFSTSEKLKSIKLNNYPKFGSLICYEIIFPDNVLNRKNKPKWIVVLTNDGWYGKSSGPYQHLVAAQMRAVEEGVTVVRSANSGISAIISPIGKIINKIGLHEKGFIDTYLPRKMDVNTIYNVVGKWGVLSVVILILIIFISFDVIGKHLKRKMTIDT